MLQLIGELLARTTDRRAERRFQTTFGTVCYLERLPGQDDSGLVWDISTGGVGLLLSSPPAKGAVLPLTLVVEDGRASLSVSLTVAHIRQLSTGDFFVGGRFGRKLTEVEIAPFITADAEPRQPVEAAPRRTAMKRMPASTSTWINRSR